MYLHIYCLALPRVSLGRLGNKIRAYQVIIRIVSTRVSTYVRA